MDWHQKAKELVEALKTPGSPEEGFEIIAKALDWAYEEGYSLGFSEGYDEGYKEAEDKDID